MSVTLSSLENMAGLAVALNLAYLNLPDLRYRRQIRDSARRKLEFIGPNWDEERRKKSRAFNDICILADDMPKYKPYNPEPSDHFKDQKWYGAWKSLFVHRVDRKGNSKSYTNDQAWVAVATAATIVILIFSAADQIGWSEMLPHIPAIGPALDYLLIEQGKKTINLPFLTVVWAFVLPIIFILRGRNLIRGCKTYVHAVETSAEQELAKAGESRTDEELAEMDDLDESEKRAKYAENLTGQTLIEHDNPPLIEDATERGVSAEYRRKVSAKIWHSHAACRFWPTESYISEPEQPEGKHCAKCDALNKK